MRLRFRSRLALASLGLLTGLTACGGDGTGPDGGGGDGGTGLTSGTPMTGRSGAAGSQMLYRVTVPTGATSLLVTTTGGTGDVDLLVRGGQAPTATAADCVSDGGDNEESCTITSPAGGTWYVLLHAAEAYSGVTLTATVTTGGGGGGGGGAAVTWASIATGATHVCALTTAGKAYCWGGYVNGQLGDGKPIPGGSNQSRPVAVVGGHTFRELSAGTAHTCGIRTDGALYCWGSNTNGQIGDGGSTNGADYSAYRTAPVAVMAGTTFLSVAAGSNYTCAVATGGTTYCWGDNGYQQASGGKFGAPSTILTPRDAQIGTALTKVYAGYSTACGLTAAGVLWCWGDRAWGMMGNGRASTDPGAGPQIVVGGPYTQASISGFLACAVGTDGGTWCWGQNDDGELGFLPSGDYLNDMSNKPLRVAGTQSWAQVSAAAGAACATTTAGAMYCWGLNNVGQGGTGSSTPRNLTPSPVTGGLAFAATSRSPAGNYMCGVTTAGAAYCWGDNASSRLGNSSAPASGAPSPLRVDNPL